MTFTPTSRALLVMDMQNALVQRLASPELVARIERSVAHARDNNILPIFVRVAFRDGHPEIVRSNPGFAGAAATGGFTESSNDTQIHGGVGYRPDDVVVTKRRVGAFSGSDLSEILRGHGAKELIMCGVATSGVILSTIRLASDLDYGLKVLSDGCADGDAEVHDLLMTRVFPKQASVVTVEQWITGAVDA